MKEKEEYFRLTPHGFFSIYEEGGIIEDALIMYMLKNKCNAIIWDSDVPELILERVELKRGKHDKRTSSKKV